MTAPQPIAGPSVAAEADVRVVTVVGATGHLGGYIVEALIKRGVHVRAMVRATSNRTSLRALGITDFVVGDLNDAASLQSAMRAEPRAAAVIASAAGFSAHSAKTKADNSKADTEGYRNLIDATKAAGVPRFILISILGCDRAPNVPHFSQKFEAEKHLKAVGATLPFPARRRLHRPFARHRAGATSPRACSPTSCRARPWRCCMPAT